jgi:hypothetical protein
MCIRNGENRYMIDPKCSKYLQNIYNSVSKIKEMGRHKDRKSGLRKRMKGVSQFCSREGLENFRNLLLEFFKRKLSEKRMNIRRKVM